MTKEELQSLFTAIFGTERQRAGEKLPEVIVTLRRPDEIETLMHEIAALRRSNADLQRLVDERSDAIGENQRLRSLLRICRQRLKAAGLDVVFLNSFSR